MPEPTHDPWLLDLLSGAASDSRIVCRLYKEAVDPASTHVLGDFNEADFPGYEEEEVVPSGRSAFVPNQCAFFRSDLVVFEFDEESDGQTRVYGFFVVQEFLDGSEELIGFNAFRVPFDLNAESAAFGIRIYLSSELSLIS